jgi:hypothetical protein
MRLLPELERRLDSTPDRASSVLLLQNQNLYKWRTTSSVWCVDFHCEGVFIGVNGTSTDLKMLVWCQVVVGRPSNVASQSGGAVSTDSSVSSSCRCMASKAQAEPTQTLAGRPRSCTGRSTPGSTQPVVWPTWSTCQIPPHGDDDFVIWSTSLCHPLKCSNLVPKLLKSNKH